MKFGVADYGLSVWDGELYDLQTRLEDLILKLIQSRTVSINFVGKVFPLQMNIVQGIQN